MRSPKAEVNAINITTSGARVLCGAGVGVVSEDQQFQQLAEVLGMIQ